MAVRTSGFLFAKFSRAHHVGNIIYMKLVRIYDVVKDETFLVDLLDRELTLTALVAVIQERGKDNKDYH